MQLSEHDLKQLDEERIRSLAAENLRTLSLKLLADLKEAHDRLNQSPDNSSRPPSSRAPWERASLDGHDDGKQEDEEPTEIDRSGEQEAEPNEPAPGAQDTKGVEQEQSKPTEKSPGKPGKPKGAPGHGRTVELAVTAQRTHRPDECSLCRQPLPPDAPEKAYTGRYEIDITSPCSGAPGLELTHTLHTHLECQCGCGHWTRAEPGRCAGEEGWTVALTE